MHGMGREDVDARMLGRGRPFIVEIKEPRKRRIDLEAAVGRINASGIVEVDQLVPATGAGVVTLKGGRASKALPVRPRLPPPPDEAKFKWTPPRFVDVAIALCTPSTAVRPAALTTHAPRWQSV